MFKKILVGYDGSKGGKAALQRAATMSRQVGAELTAVWVREPLPRHSDLPGEYEEEAEAADEYFKERQRKWGKLRRNTASRLSAKPGGDIRPRPW